MDNQLNIILTGELDSGKSTLIGRLLFDTHSLSRESEKELRFTKELNFANLLDSFQEERDGEFTLDTTQAVINYKKIQYTFIDAPGHKELIKNMLTGSSYAEAAIVVIDAQKGLEKQTKRHLHILKFLGIVSIIAVVNKMDSIHYEKSAFQKVSDEISRFLERIQIKSLCVIPVSAKEGQNLLKESKKMTWHKKGPLIKYLQLLGLSYKKINSNKQPLRFPVQDIYEINGEKIIAGRLESGVLEKSKTILILPSNEEITVSAIKIFGKHNPLKAYAGQNIGLVLNKSVPVKRGCIFVDKDFPPKHVNRFESRILWLSDIPIEINRTIFLRCSTQETECSIEKIHEVINNISLVTIITKTPVIMEKFSSIRELGRFVIEKDSGTIGIGTVI